MIVVSPVFSAFSVVTIYLLPALLLMGLLASAVRLRYHIEPACPGCGGRTWKDPGGSMACAACGWSAALQPATVDRQAA